MSNKTNSGDDLLSPEDMKLWLEIETSAARMAAARREEDASHLVNEFVEGKLTKEQANQRLEEHEARWGNGSTDTELGWQLREQASEKVLQRRLSQKAKLER